MTPSEREGNGALQPRWDHTELPAASRRHPLWKDVADHLWEDWHWQAQNSIRSVRQLRNLLRFSPEELEGVMSGSGAGMVDVVQFVDQSDIDPIYYRSSYYLAPEKTGVKAYRILLDALQDKGMVGIAKVAIREREYLATLRADEGVIVMETMYWPDEIREPRFEILEEDVRLAVEDAVPLLDEGTPERLREVALAGARWS